MKNTADSIRSGFTLIELSIVLVIIGLIAGGILTGQELIKAAAIRAQVTQIERYNTAVRTFQNKFGYLPGDLPNPYASNFGFWARGGSPGQGDGDGVLMGNCGSAASLNFNNQTHECNYESGFGTVASELTQFWIDLSTANLIDASIIGYWASGTNYSTVRPPAKIGQGNYVYTFSLSGINYFALSTIGNIGWTIQTTTTPGLSVQQAYNIDKKIDDGLPQSGSVSTCYVNYNVAQYATVYAAGYSGGTYNYGANNGNTNTNYVNNCNPTTAATPYASTNCYDNNNVAGTETYSLAQNANVQNCALSFRFQ